jgi:hypothetical protein
MPVTKRRVCLVPIAAEVRDDHNSKFIIKPSRDFGDQGRRAGWLYMVVIIPVVVFLLIVPCNCERRTAGG